MLFCFSGLFCPLLVITHLNILYDSVIICHFNEIIDFVHCIFSVAKMYTCVSSNMIKKIMCIIV